MAVDALRTRTYQRSAAFGAYAELFVIRRFDDFKLFRNVFALAHRFDEQHGGVAQGAHGIGITEHTNGTLFVFRKHRKAGVAVHTLDDGAFDFVMAVGEHMIFKRKVIGIKPLSRHEQCRFAVFSVNGQVADDGEKDLFILRGNGGNRISYLFGKRFVGQTVFCVHKITSGSADVGDRMLLILISFRERYHKKSAVSTLFRENTAVCGVKIL